MTRDEVLARGLLIGTATACGWETAMIIRVLMGRPAPTISQIVDHHPILGLAVLGGLAAHFYWRASLRLIPNMEVNP